MKKYDVTVTECYQKTIFVYADSLQEAAKKVETILFDTDIIDFTDENLISGEAVINEASEDDFTEEQSENGDTQNEPCSDCAYLCPVCGDCLCEDKM